MEMKKMKEMKGMRKGMGVLIIALLITHFSLLISCSSIDCPVQNLVYTRYMLYQPNGKPDTLDLDTMWVKTRKANGKDSTVLNSLCGDNATGFSLPISHTQSEDKFLVLMRKYGQTVGYYYDSIIVKKEDYPHFESVDCQPSYFHKITGVRCLGNIIDSVVIKNPTVNYDTKSSEHFRIYINPDF